MAAKSKKAKSAQYYPTINTSTANLTTPKVFAVVIIKNTSFFPSQNRGVFIITTFINLVSLPLLMQVLTKEDFNYRREEILKKIKEGKLFIHPTDTIYGIGCNAKDSHSVKKVRETKNRPKNPFSIIAPSKGWIYENCIVSEEAKKWISKLPGPYTLVLKLKNRKAIAEEVAPNVESIGIRMPDHWFTKAVEEINMPVISTSANLVGEDYMTSIDDLHSDIKSRMEFIIYEGEKKGRPSTIVELIEEKEKIISR